LRPIENIGDKDIEEKNIGDKDIEEKNIGDKDIEEKNIGDKDIEEKNIGDKDIEEKKEERCFFCEYDFTRDRIGTIPICAYGLAREYHKSFEC
jgi:hypothetical protein